MCVPCYTEQGSGNTSYLKPWQDGEKADEPGSSEVPTSAAEPQLRAVTKGNMCLWEQISNPEPPGSPSQPRSPAAEVRDANVAHSEQQPWPEHCDSRWLQS